MHERVLKYHLKTHWLCLNALEELGLCCVWSEKKNGLKHHSKTLTGSARVAGDAAGGAAGGADAAAAAATPPGRQRVQRRGGGPAGAAGGGAGGRRHLHLPLPRAPAGSLPPSGLVV